MVALAIELQALGFLVARVPTVLLCLLAWCSQLGLQSQYPYVNFPDKAVEAVDGLVEEVALAEKKMVVMDCPQNGT